MDCLTASTSVFFATSLVLLNLVRLKSKSSKSTDFLVTVVALLFIPLNLSRQHRSSYITTATSFAKLLEVTAVIGPEVAGAIYPFANTLPDADAAAFAFQAILVHTNLCTLMRSQIH